MNHEHQDAGVVTSEGSTAAVNAADQSVDPSTNLPDSEDVRAYMDGIPPDNPPAVIDRDWRTDLIMSKGRDDKLFPEKKSMNNVYLRTRFEERLRGLFIMNEFSQRKMLVGCPPWEKPARFKPRDVRDEDYFRIHMELERMGMKPSQGNVMAAVEAICRDRSFHPVRKFFNALKWDGQERLGKWLTYYMGAESQPDAYLEAVGKKWLVAGVARIMQPGCKFDHMLILEGSTDIGKSRALRVLSTFHGESYFFDGINFGMIQDKDTTHKLQGNLIIEFPELSNLHNREVEDVKQWITIQEDVGRKPYAREQLIYPRQFILAGSTNNSEYLRDTTGNKRFWPVKCGDRIDIEALGRDSEQLWAEASALYKSGFPWWIADGDSVTHLINEEHRPRMVSDIWEDAVLEYAEKSLIPVSVKDILLEKIKIPLEKLEKRQEMRVADILKRAGYKKMNKDNRKAWSK